MKWFVAKIVYRIISGEGKHTAQYDEQLRMISACNKQQALQKARSTGLQEQVSFINEKGRQVQWKFLDVCDIYSLDAIVDGTELYSRIEEKENALIYEDVIHAKARQLINEVNTPNLQHI